ncbi:MAG: glutamate--tRNA ligase [Candidatus Yanofskybacteria bacterium]|nr:glutamate--tRNA ligase [Candidatus Yanofskybacteria bacterium]
MTKVKKEIIRVRIAPSPTGYLHIGTARTALFNWLFARHKSEGKFILRIEDTDIERSEKKFEDDIIAQLEWLGLKWDEFYKQSDRTKIYSKYIQKLLDDGKAFWCYHSEEELEKERQEQMSGKGVPTHWCSHKPQTSNLKPQNLGKGIIRLVADEKSTRKIKFNDIIRGEIEFEERLLGDISIAKAVDTPLYHFAVVIDDYEMDITHVIRGEDHIANTPKQILLQEAFGFEQPQYAHLPLILGTDRSKLSKRHAATSVAEYRKLGYLPDALVNFLFLLGWTPEKSNHEILTKNEVIEQFSLEKVHKSGAVFDIKKLNWINSQYIKMENDGGLAKLVQPFIEKHYGPCDEELIIKIVPLLRERLEYLDQVKEFHFFFKEPEYEKELLKWKSRSNEEIKNSFKEIQKIVEGIGVEDKNKLRQELDMLGKRFEDRGLAYWPFRVALTGEKASPDPVDIAYILGKEKTLKRIQKAVNKI